MKLETASRTDVGRSRKGRNEDAVGLRTPDEADVLEGYGVLLSVADGVGGAPRGDEASRIAVETVLRTYYQASADVPIMQRLKTAFAKANAAVMAADDVPFYRHMCTTLVAAAVFPDRVVFANVGDSRGYVIPSRTGAARQITVDHSEVQEMVREGLITPEEAEVAFNRNIITRVVGTDSDVEVDVFDVPLTVGDTVLLCSDGLVTAVTDAEIAHIVQQNPVEVAVDRLIRLAKGPKGHDNVSVCTTRVLV